MRRALGALLGAGLLFAGVPAPAGAAGEIPLRPGESTTLEPGVAVPSLPPKLDFVLLMDTSGSMLQAMTNAKTGAYFFDDEVVAEVPDANFAVASFEDYPTAPYGSLAAGDQPYRLHSDLTANEGTYQTAVDSLTLHQGGDTADAQVTALHQLATGLGIAGTGGATVPAGADISFRAGSAHYVALISNGPFHDDPTGLDSYSFSPTPSYATMTAALAADEARVIAEDLSSPTAEPDMSSLATSTAGAYDQGDPQGTGVWGDVAPGNVKGILGVMRDIAFPATAAASCDPLDVSLNPGSWPTTLGGDTLSTEEMITVPQGVSAAELPPGGAVDCEVAYSWGDVAIGSTQAAVQVILLSVTDLEVAKTKRKLRAAGGVEPAHVGEVVEVTLSRKKQGAYQPIATKQPVLASDGSFKASFPRPASGRCEVEAAFPGDADHDPSSDSSRFRC